MSAPMLSVRDLAVTLRGAPLVRDVSFDIAPGEVMGLVGESGSGKSMTALALMALLPYRAEAQGAALLDGVDLLPLPEPQMCRLRGAEIGMIFQEPMTALNPMQTIGAQVAEALVVHRRASRWDALEIARARLDRVGLDAARVPLDRFPHELSGGQRQRVCIAMATALRPKLLIADEPTTALDVTTQAAILELLKDLVATEGMSLLLITHDLAVVSRMAARVAVMSQGRIVEQGRTEAVFRQRSAPYTRQLFAASAHVPRRAPPPLGAPLLEVRDVVRAYPLPRDGLLGSPRTLRAVDGVSLTLREGESVGLVGESGCGKSTLTRAILGLDPIQSGEIRLGGEPVIAGRMSHEQRARVQVVFQDPFGSFDPRHRVERLVAEPFHLRPCPRAEQRERVAAALVEVGLSPDDMRKYIHEFSGGQRQRIAIARALIIRPALIVLDEAVSALDVRVRAQILDLLADLQQRLKLSYLFVSHDLAVVRGITDRVMVMRKGRIIEDGPTAEVFGAPRQAYTAQLIAATPRIPAGWLEETA
ncbi:ABC transporter ATP-binding protein [Haematobacter massiliensis]